MVESNSDHNFAGHHAVDYGLIWRTSCVFARAEPITNSLTTRTQCRMRLGAIQVLIAQLGEQIYRSRVRSTVTAQICAAWKGHSSHAFFAPDLPKKKNKESRQGGSNPLRHFIHKKGGQGFRSLLREDICGLGRAVKAHA